MDTPQGCGCQRSAGIERSLCFDRRRLASSPQRGWAPTRRCRLSPCSRRKSHAFSLSASGLDLYTLAFWLNSSGFPLNPQTVIHFLQGDQQQPSLQEATLKVWHFRVSKRCSCPESSSAFTAIAQAVSWAPGFASGGLRGQWCGLSAGDRAADAFFPLADAHAPL